MKLKNLKFTPLTIVIAVCITYSIYLLLGFGEDSGAIYSVFKAFYTIILAVVLSVADILFRKFIENKTWLWLIQGSFILLIILMIVIFETI